MPLVLAKEGGRDQGDSCFLAKQEMSFRGVSVVARFGKSSGTKHQRRWQSCLSKPV